MCNQGCPHSPVLPDVAPKCRGYRLVPPCPGGAAKSFHTEGFVVVRVCCSEFRCVALVGLELNITYLKGSLVTCPFSKEQW